MQNHPILLSSFVIIKFRKNYYSIFEKLWRVFHRLMLDIFPENDQQYFDIPSWSSIRFD
jgi:hypothetical protein